LSPAEGNAYASRRAAYYTLGLLTVVYSFNFIDRQLLAILQEAINHCPLGGSIQSPQYRRPVVIYLELHDRYKRPGA
jgi:hypothetical protein